MCITQRAANRSAYRGDTPKSASARNNDRNARMSLTKRLKRLSEKFAFAFAINNKVFKLALAMEMEMEMKPSEELLANATPSANTKMELDRSSKRTIDGSMDASGKC